MTIIDIFHALLCAMVVVLGLNIWKKYIHRPDVWLLDDQKSEIDLLVMRLDQSRYNLRTFTTSKDMFNAYIKALATCSGTPSCTLIDYNLNEDMTGAKLLSMFRKNGVKSVIITGYEGALDGVNQQDIILKTSDDSFYSSVNNWILKATGQLI